uniref:Uncharacterized protein n=1 Tax=Prolemur simus TaxID=1328070 RepID=A0A8C9AL53_PROSS
RVAGTCALLGRLRQEDHLSPGVPGCSELWLCHLSPAWSPLRHLSQASSSSTFPQLWQLLLLGHLCPIPASQS